MLKRNKEIERDVFDIDVPDWVYEAWVKDDEYQEAWYEAWIDGKDRTPHLM